MSDKYIANVELLCGFEGSDGATSYNEESNGRAATFAGNAQLDTAQFRYGSSALLLDGSGDFVSFADSADFTLGTSDFTIECWVRFASTPGAGTQRFVTHYNAGGNQRGWLLGYTSGSGGGLQFAYSTNGIANTVVQASDSWSPVGGVWYHAAVSRRGATLYVFLDGVLQISHNIGVASIFNTTSVLRIGAETSPETNFFNGWVDEVRLTVGRGRYVADFIPPQGPYSRAKRTGVIGGAAQPTIGVYR